MIEDPDQVYDLINEAVEWHQRIHGCRPTHLVIGAKMLLLAVSAKKFMMIGPYNMMLGPYTPTYLEPVLDPKEVTTFMGLTIVRSPRQWDLSVY